MLAKANGTAIKYDYCGACTFFLGAITVNLVVQALAGFVAAGFNTSASGDFNTAFMIVIQCAFALFIYLFTKINNYRLDFTFFNDARTGKKPNAACFAVPVIGAAALLVAMYLPTLWYGYFTVYGLGIPADYFDINISTVSSVVMIVIASVFFAPVCEEVIYRGVLFCGLERRFSPTKAALLSAFAFTIMHMSPAQVVFQFALGLASAALMHRSGRLLPSVLLHATSNALALTVELTPLGAKLAAAELWLVNNIVAAVFITLGLLAVGGAALFALFKYAFPVRSVGDQSDGQGELSARDRMIADMRDRNGSVRYWIAVGICGAVFAVNLAVAML